MGLGIACENAREAALAMAHKFSQLPRAPLRALVALSRIEELQPHLNAALGYQVDFIMNPNFAAFAQKLLSR
jgi:hypothetical protein